MSNNSPRINTLFQLYLNNGLTHDEYQEFLSLLAPDTIGQSLHTELKELWAQSADQQISISDKVWDDKINFLIQQINTETVFEAPVKRLTNWYKLRWAAAAALLIFSSGIFYLLQSPKSPATINDSLTKTVTDKGILPGGNKAVLTLADGTSIILDSASNGTIANQGATKIIKLNTGQLVYNSSGADPAAVSYNTLTTPRGGQYQVTLQDGTVVWLNSGSSLRYPTAFIGKERKVEIAGEAYFEVAKNDRQPFKVKINLVKGEGGEVEVLGTHFNINAYDDEATVNTTLFEGSVNVNLSKGTSKIKPGQQFQSNSIGQIKIVTDPNLEEVIAWKEGRFQFDNADINHVMRQLARWYDIEVGYKGIISKHFGGTISRNVNMLQVLNMLELTGEVNFKIDGKKVVVIP